MSHNWCSQVTIRECLVTNAKEIVELIQFKPVKEKSAIYRQLIEGSCKSRQQATLNPGSTI